MLRVAWAQEVCVRRGCWFDVSAAITDHAYWCLLALSTYRCYAMRLQMELRREGERIAVVFWATLYKQCLHDGTPCCVGAALAGATGHDCPHATQHRWYRYRHPHKSRGGQHRTYCLLGAICNTTLGVN